MPQEPPNLNKTAVISNKHLQITALPPPFPPMPLLSAMLSRPEFCTKLPPVVKMPPREKIGNRSNDVIIYYVNFHILSTALLPCGKPLWTTMWRMWKSISFQQLLAPFRKNTPAVENSFLGPPPHPCRTNYERITSPPPPGSNRDFFIEFVVNPPKPACRNLPSPPAGRKCL